MRVKSIMLQQIRFLLKKVAFLFTVLLFLISLYCTDPQSASASSFLDLKKQATEAGASITETVSDLGKSAIQKAANTSTALGRKALYTSQVTFNESVQVGRKVGTTTLRMGNTVTHKALDTSGAIGNAALKAGKSATKMAINTSKQMSAEAIEFEKSAVLAAENLGTAAAQKTVLVAEQTTTKVKLTSKAVAHQIVEAFKQNTQPLLEAAISQVDLNQLEALVRQIQQEVSEHTPEALAKKLIARKVLESSETESWIEIARLQAEMIYQIAAAYGFELRSTARKQEILDIAAVNLGSGELLEKSMPFVKYFIGQIPVVGDVLGVVVDWGSDRAIRSLMFPVLGQGACKYYTNLQASSINAINTQSNF